MSTSNNNHPKKFEFYRYDPSFAAAVLFATLFFLTTLLHTFQLIRWRAWFAIPLAVGGYFEVVGYIGRVISSKQSPNYAEGPYIIQTLLLLIAPALFAATIYMTLGRIIILTHGEACSPIRRKWLTKIFVCGDVLSFFTQGAGGGLMSAGNSGYNTGQDVIIVGLFIQIVFFGLFVITAITFHRRLSKAPTAQSLDPQIPWRKYMLVLYITSALILIRSVYRVIEYVEGNDGYIMRHEWFLYVFDGVLMLSVMLLLNAVHPGHIKQLLKRRPASSNDSKEQIRLSEWEADDGSPNGGVRPGHAWVE